MVFERTLFLFLMTFKQRCHTIGVDLKLSTNPQQQHPYLKVGNETAAYVKDYFGLPKVRLTTLIRSKTKI